MMLRKKIILATIIVGMALLINLTMGNVDDGNLVPEQRDYITEPEDPFYRDYIVIKSEGGSLLLIPKEKIDDMEMQHFKKLTSKSHTTPFIESEDFDNVNKFSSFEELRSYIENHTKEYYYQPYGGTISFASSRVTEGSVTTDLSADDYSTTNVQVSGVDEGDIVKTDGDYAYIISKDRCSVFIVDVNPPEEAVVVSTINTKGNIKEIYVKGNALVVIGQRGVYQIDPSPSSNENYYYPVDYDGNIIKMDTGKPYYLNYIYYQATFIDIFDLSIKDEPELAGSHLIKGSAVQSRMIDDFLYVITSKYLSRNFKEYELPVDASEIYFLNSTNDTNYFSYYMQLTTILSIDVTNPSEIINVKALLMDYSSNIYVSTANIYITYYKYDYINGMTKTRIHRILIDNGMFLYQAYGEIEGTLLSRFSMDEHHGYFRVATSIGWTISHNINVLNMDLNVVGKLEDIAPGERLFSARFMGDRAYLVTFVIRTGDPFFVIDLSDPKNPELLGELHIPGWSDYLHPYDENHVIGLGREAVLNGPIEGIKLSLFDVTDVENPQEISKFVIGDRSSSTIAASEPHAFLFSREKNLLVIPVKLNYTTSCAYVFNISLENGFELKGTVSHPSDYNNQPGYYWYYYINEIKRSFYITDTLFTLSDNYLKMNDLHDLHEINILKLPNEYQSTTSGQVMCIYIEPFIW